MTEGVCDQVRDEPLDQLRVAGGAGGLERRGPRQFAMILRSEDVAGGRGKVDGLPSQMFVFASGEGEKRLEQPFLSPAGSDDALAHLPQGDRVGVRVSERGLRERDL